MHIRKTHRTVLLSGMAVIAGLSLAGGTPALATGTGQSEGHPSTGPSATSATPSAPAKPVQETGIYLYEKKEKDKPAAWENSKTQTLLTTQEGHRWFTDITALIPSEVCGDGWAVQQDQLESPEAIAWPETINYPEGFPGNVTLVDAKHQELADVAQVPDCGATDKPSESPAEQPSPSPSSPTDKPSESPTEHPSPSPSSPTDGPGESPSPKPAPTGSATPTPTGTAPAPKGTATPVPSGSPTTTPAAPAITPAGTDPSATDPALASTGADGLFTAVAGAGVLGLGTVLVLLSRRRGRHS